MMPGLQYYELAEDYLSLVRVYCYCDNLSKAADVANASGDRAACYHLARQYENIDNITEAIHFFTKAQVKEICVCVHVSLLQAFFWTFFRNDLQLRVGETLSF